MITLLPALSGCAIPGSMLAHYRIEGEVRDRKTNKPLSNHSFQISSSGKPGLSATEASMPEAAGAKDVNSTVSTSSDGKFVKDQEKVIHASLMILPPLGWHPKRPPQPLYAIAPLANCSRVWGVNLDRDPPEVRRWDWKENEFATLRQGEPSPITAQNDLGTCKEGSDECRTHVTSKIQFSVDPNESCDEENALAKESIKLTRPRHNWVFGSYGNVFLSSIGGGYRRTFFPSGFLALELPFGFYGRSYSVAALVKLRFLQIWRFGAQVGLGPQWLEIHSADSIGSTYSTDVSGIKAMVVAGLEASITRGIFAEAGYANTTIEQSRFDGRFYAQLGYKF